MRLLEWVSSAKTIAGICALGACCVSFYTIFKHLRFSKHKSLRNYYIRIRKCARALFLSLSFG